MKIISIYIYPIKSLGGISVQTSTLLERGLEFDRRWMIVDSNGVFVTQRQFPALVLFSVSITDLGLSIQNGNKSNIVQIPLDPLGKKVEVKVWDDFVRATEVSEEVSEWFSNQLNQDVRLVFMGKDSNRLIDTKYANHNETVSFADGYPVLIANTASMDDLNLRLENKISIERFRPNIVVLGNEAFEEDKWTNITLGNSRVKVVKKCARCVMVNINPNTAVKEKEVLQKLSTYRKEGAKVLFGVNALIIQEGNIQVGDELLFTD